MGDTYVLHNRFLCKILVTRRLKTWYRKYLSRGDNGILRMRHGRFVPRCNKVASCFFLIRSSEERYKLNETERFSRVEDFSFSMSPSDLYYQFYKNAPEGNWDWLQGNLFQWQLYKFEWLSHSDAEEYCVRQGGHLASVTSAREQKEIQQIKTQSRASQFWLGGRRTAEGESWRWHWHSWKKIASFSDFYFFRISGVFFLILIIFPDFWTKIEWGPYFLGPSGFSEFFSSKT